MIKQRKVLIEKYNPEYPVHAMDDLFRKLVKDFSIDRYFHNYIYFRDEHGCAVMIQSLKGKTMWVRYMGVMEPLHSKFNLDYEQIKYFFQTRIELHFGLSGYEII